MKTTLGIIVVIILFVVGFSLFNRHIPPTEQEGTTLAASPKDATYIINGKPVTLKDGVSETEAAPGSASKIITRYFGNDVTLDLDDDGRDDSVFLLTQETGGSGTFFYVVAALNTENGYAGSQALFLGDRIAPQTTDLGKGKQIIVNYADRAPGESFADRPSVGKSMYLLFNPETMQFGEVAQDFEGEADPSRMTLGMKTWNWVKTQYNNDTEVVPNEPGVFTLTFRDDGTFSATTDCNAMSGSYETDGSSISFGPIAMTKKYCEGSQETVFAKDLQDIHAHLFTSKGELVLELPVDTGTMVFR